jgi:SOS-response transcriptional repressor LexA
MNIIFIIYKRLIIREEKWCQMQILDKIQPHMKSTAQPNIHEILGRLMFQRGIRTTDLARRTNVPQPTLSRIMSGTTANPHQSSLEAIANFFQLTVDQLKGLQPIPWLDPITPEAAGWKKIPLLTWEQATKWTEGKCDLSDNELLFSDAKVGNRAYALTVKDASMEPQFSKDTLLIIDPDKKPKDRSYIVAILKNYPEILFRQLLIDGPYQYLKPISPDFDKFKMMLLEKDDRISGVLVQARRDYGE